MMKTASHLGAPDKLILAWSTCKLTRGYTLDKHFVLVHKVLMSYETMYICMPLCNCLFQSATWTFCMFSMVLLCMYFATCLELLNLLEQKHQSTATLWILLGIYACTEVQQIGRHQFFCIVQCKIRYWQPEKIEYYSYYYYYYYYY